MAWLMLIAAGCCEMFGVAMIGGYTGTAIGRRLPCWFSDSEAAFCCCRWPWKVSRWVRPMRYGQGSVLPVERFWACCFMVKPGICGGLCVLF